MPWRRLVLGVILAIALGAVGWRWYVKSRGQETNRSATLPASYVGHERCAPCHLEEVNAWRTSHHARAMQIASAATVLGHFNNASFAKDGVVSRFNNSGGNFYVRTDGSNGQPQDYPIPYTFGVYPLQQYLVASPDGRLQSFGVAWDSRAREQGGQHWFDLYPNQAISRNDPLHWTGRNQVWNYMCADCHATNLRTNYDLAKDSYATTWSEIGVSCESCHGPGSKHVAWGESHNKNAYDSEDHSAGLVVDLRASNGSWSQPDRSTATLHWRGNPRSRTELETCAPCHSRRHAITNNYQLGQAFLDAYVPALLEKGLYYADGQVLGEDYEWGSFLQSKMYREGVTCSDCHDPHSDELMQVGFNAVCGKCHLLSKFGAAAHTHHKPDTPGSLCVNCHMPTKTYMVVDARRDHSFRVPRPDYSVAYGTPNACNQCHRDKSAKWAAGWVASWYGSRRGRELHFVEAIDAGRRGSRNAETALAALIANSDQPAIARATALSLLSEYLTTSSVPIVQMALGDKDALVRSAAVRSLEPLPSEQRVRLVAPLLADPIRSVRIEAARLLAGSPQQLLRGGQRVSLDHAIPELIAAEMASSERPESHINLASLYVQMGRTADAQNELRTALRLDPNFVPAMINLADLYRVQQRDEEGERWLEKAISIAPDSADALHALGLLKIRQKRYADALTFLARAASLQPDNPRYSYVYAVALDSSGQTDAAIDVLRRAHDRRPANRDLLKALVEFERDKGNLPLAVTYARQLIEIAPDDAQAKGLLGGLFRQQRRFLPGKTVRPSSPQ